MNKKVIIGITTLAAVVISSTVVYAANTTTGTTPADTARSFTENIRPRSPRRPPLNPFLIRSFPTLACIRN